MNSLPLALVHTKEAFDLIGVAAVVSLGAFSSDRLRRKDAKKRAEQKEKQAEYARRHLRWDREREDALRYFGTGVR